MPMTIFEMSLRSNITILPKAKSQFEQEKLGETIPPEIF